MSKNGYSRTGLFGTTTHYDSSGKKIGESRPGLFGSTTHYDASGNKTGHSERSIFGGQNHYDSHGHKTGYSEPSVFGGMNHYDSHGNKTGYNSGTVFGGSNYYGNDTDDVAFRHDATHWERMQRDTSTYSGGYTSHNSASYGSQSSGPSSPAGGKRSYGKTLLAKSRLRADVEQRQKNLYAAKSVIKDVPVEKMIEKELNMFRDPANVTRQILERMISYETVEFFYTQCKDKELFRTKDGAPLFEGELTRETYRQAIITMAEEVGFAYSERIRERKEEERREELARQKVQKQVQEMRRREQAQEEEKRRQRQKSFERFVLWAGGIIIATLILVLGGQILKDEVIIPKINMQTLETAIEQVENGEMEAAEASFDKLGKFNSWSKELQDVYYTEYDAQYEAGNYEYLTRLEKTFLPKDKEKLCSIYAGYGEKAEKKKHYKTAAEHYTKAYYYSPLKYSYLDARKRCYYQYGIKLYNEKKYKSAIEAFQNVKDYKKSSTYIKKCHYQRGLNFYKKGKYKEAEDAFLAADGYKQSEHYITLSSALYWKKAGYYNHAYDDLKDLPESFAPAQKYIKQKWFKLVQELDGTKWVGSGPADDGYEFYYYFEFDGGRLAMEKVYSRFSTWADLYENADHAYPGYDLNEIKMKQGNLLRYEDYDQFLQIKSYDGYSLKLRWYRQQSAYNTYIEDEETITLTRY